MVFSIYGDSNAKRLGAAEAAIEWSHPRITSSHNYVEVSQYWKTTNGHRMILIQGYNSTATQTQLSSGLLKMMFT